MLTHTKRKPAHYLLYACSTHNTYIHTSATDTPPSHLHSVKQQHWLHMNWTLLPKLQAPLPGALEAEMLHSATERLMMTMMMNESRFGSDV
jgi:hypothetical protein